jgi:hypothetical protein
MWDGKLKLAPISSSSLDRVGTRLYAIPHAGVKAINSNSNYYHYVFAGLKSCHIFHYFITFLFAILMHISPHIYFFLCTLTIIKNECGGCMCRCRLMWRHSREMFSLMYLIIAHGAWGGPESHWIPSLFICARDNRIYIYIVTNCYSHQNEIDDINWKWDIWSIRHRHDLLISQWDWLPHIQINVDGKTIID